LGGPALEVRWIRRVVRTDDERSRAHVRRDALRAVRRGLADGRAAARQYRVLGRTPCCEQSKDGQPNEDLPHRRPPHFLAPHLKNRAARMSPASPQKIGRASCREREEICVVDDSFNKKNQPTV